MVKLLVNCEASQALVNCEPTSVENKVRIQVETLHSGCVFIVSGEDEKVCLSIFIKNKGKSTFYYLRWFKNHWKIHKNCMVFRDGKIMHHDWLLNLNFNFFFHSPIGRYNKVPKVRFTFNVVPKSEQFTCKLIQNVREVALDLKEPENVKFFQLTSSVVQFWVGCENLFKRFIVNLPPQILQFAIFKNLKYI